MDTELKTCKKCLQQKPSSEFRSNGKRGLRNACAQCERAQQNAAYRADPAKFSAKNKASYARNIERRRKGSSLYYHDNREAILEKAKLYRNKNSERINAKTRKWRADLKCEMVEAYGGQCSCCGEKEIAFLTLEHTNGDGAAHRRALKHPNKVYTDLKRRGWPKDGYDVLCFNCNCATAGGKVCPHKLQQQAAK